MKNPALTVTVFDDRVDHLRTTMFLHGFMGSAVDWTETAAGFNGPSFGLDLPGHGDSIGLNTSDYSFERTVELIVDSIDSLGLNSVNVVGYSMGGRLALALACTHPERVSNLILESASPGLKTISERSERVKLDAQRSMEIRTDFRSFLERWFKQPMFSTLDNDPGRRDRLIQVRSRNAPEEIACALVGLGTGNQPSYWESLSLLTSRTVAIVGSEDHKFVRIAGEMVSNSDRIETIIIPSAGHNVHLERSKAYLEIVNSTLTSQSGTD